MSSSICANKAKWYLNEDGAVDTDFITKNEVVKSRGIYHTPISSAEILTKFRDRAKALGIEIANEKGALLKVNDKGVGGDRYIYTADVVDSAHPDYALSIGFRNFGDKSLAFSGCCGTRVFICENGLCTSLVKPSKMRHTIGNVMRNKGMLDSKIDSIFSRFLEDAPKIHGQVETLKGHKLTDEIVGKFVRKANGEWKVNRKGEKVFAKNPYIGSSNLLRILEDLENPSYNSHDDDSCFRLLNACTKVTTHDIKNPNQSMMASRFCNNLILGLIDPDFTPLGDDVAEEEEVATDDGIVVID